MARPWQRNNNRQQYEPRQQGAGGDGQHSYTPYAPRKKEMSPAVEALTSAALDALGIIIICAALGCVWGGRWLEIGLVGGLLVTGLDLVGRTSLRHTIPQCLSWLWGRVKRVGTLIRVGILVRQARRGNTAAAEALKAQEEEPATPAAAQMLLAKESPPA